MSYPIGGTRGGTSKGGGKGISSKGPATSSNSPGIPENLSFYVRIEPLSPDYNGQPPRHSEPGDWLPPNRLNGLRAGQGRVSFLRWVGGTITTVPPNDQIRTTNLDGYVYHAATVFTQAPDTEHILAVPFNARTRSVHTFGRGWQAIRFNHNQAGNNDTYFSYISVRGAERAIAAPGSPRWMPELLPPSHDCDLRHARRGQAGLIGELPLLFALAAFSAPPNLPFPSNSMRPGAWDPHGPPYGRIAERGMVVTIYIDPRNPHWSTPQLLDSLQNGDYGAFYGP